MPNVIDISFTRSVKPGDGLAVLVAAGRREIRRAPPNRPIPAK